ncbi:hypothetical protein BDQ17DRAFT_1415009 [Cyathus striatus]|nr:hypothetical protein BDQ17DRAFT_1415009 [Cyathus striatus]
MPREGLQSHVGQLRALFMALPGILTLRECRMQVFKSFAIRRSRKVYEPKICIQARMNATIYEGMKGTIESSSSSAARTQSGPNSSVAKTRAEGLGVIQGMGSSSWDTRTLGVPCLTVYGIVELIIAIGLGLWESIS